MIMLRLCPEFFEVLVEKISYSRFNYSNSRLNKNIIKRFLK